MGTGAGGGGGSSDPGGMVMSLLGKIMTGGPAPGAPIKPTPRGEPVLKPTSDEELQALVLQSTNRGGEGTSPELRALLQQLSQGRG